VKVAAVIKSLGPGGAERLLVEFAGQAAAHGIDLSVVSLLDHKRELVADIERAGSAVHCIGVRRLRQLRWVPALLRALRHQRPDVVHLHSPAIAPLVRLAAHARVLGMRRPVLVTTEHNTWSSYRPATRWATRLTARLDDATIAVSEEVRASITSPVVRRRTTCVQHGIDLARTRAASADRGVVRHSLGLDDNHIVVVTVANYRHQKNYPNLLAAAAKATSLLPMLRFVAVGQGPLRDEIEAEHRRLALGDRLLLLGYRRDTASVLAAGDLFTLASDYEGLPVALMEATALGLPVVATAVGGIAETITPAAGRLVAPADPEALAAAIVEVASDQALRERLHHGALDIAARFDAARSTAEITSIYHSAIDRRRHSP
jgi:glycosyltransferase involved in cell wall biosynthesis